jgi:hypothetical protein
MFLSYPPSPDNAHNYSCMRTSSKEAIRALGNQNQPIIYSGNYGPYNGSGVVEIMVYRPKTTHRGKVIVLYQIYQGECACASIVMIQMHYLTSMEYNLFQLRLDVVRIH